MFLRAFATILQLCPTDCYSFNIHVANSQIGFKSFIKNYQHSVKKEIQLKPEFLYNNWKQKVAVLIIGA